MVVDDANVVGVVVIDFVHVDDVAVVEVVDAAIVVDAVDVVIDVVVVKRVELFEFLYIFSLPEQFFKIKTKMLAKHL